jgi:exopolyphosphatase/pppGpp-phosphohydrolase
VKQEAKIFDPLCRFGGFFKKVSLEFFQFNEERHLRLVIKILLLGLSLFSTRMSISLEAQNVHVIRAAIDVGSGGPKLRIAEVNLTTRKIVKMMHVKQYPVIFQESLTRGGAKVLSAEIMLKGIDAIKDAIILAKSYGTTEVVIIGTSVFRNAVNGELFASMIRRETDLQVHILDQNLEGRLSFHSVLAKADLDPHHLIVWDIGGGSTQFVGLTHNGLYLVDGSNEGSGPFRDHIIQSIQGENVNERRTPNPISREHAQLAEAHASLLSANIDQELGNKFSILQLKLSVLEVSLEEVFFL